MSKRILLAGGFSLVLLAYVLYNMYTGQPETTGTVMVPLYESTDNISLRGLYATDDSVVVVGGSEGVFGFSLDAGIHWIFQQIPGAEQSQFRSVWAHNDHTFLAVSAGAPSYIYRTEDRGQSWVRTFSDTAQATFLDGIVFMDDQLGFVYGDPVDGHFKWLETRDGGQTWTDTLGPVSIDGEASFAASGSAIGYGNDILTMVTGGTVSRLHVSFDTAKTWEASYLPLQQGLPSQGAFAHAWDGTRLFIVGGNYMEEQDSTQTAMVVDLATGEEDRVAMALLEPLPYTSDVVSDGKAVYFTGTTGVRMLDTALVQLDTTAMHALAYSGKYVFVSGPQGRIGRLYNGDTDGLNTLLDAIKAARKH